VKLKSCVATTLPGDPYFKIKAELNRPFFLKGEEAKIKATCTKDCYLTIVNFTAEGKLKVLLPNDYEPSPFIKAGGVYNFPSEGLALEMHTLTGHKKDTEVFILIATKERFDHLPTPPASPQRSFTMPYSISLQTQGQRSSSCMR